MPRKRLADFIKENKNTLDAYILQRCKNGRLNNSERRDWIMNDETLYQWAKDSGVRV